MIRLLIVILTKPFEISFASYLANTMATASLRTLSPNTIAYKSTSTFKSWKIANTVTTNIIHERKIYDTVRKLTIVHAIKQHFILY